MNILLKALASIRIGQTFTKPLENKDKGDVSVLFPKDIVDGKIITTPIKIENEEVPVLEKHLLQEGDILIVNKGNKFAIFLYEGLPARAIATTSFFVITITQVSKIAPRYLNWYLNQVIVKEYFNRNALGSTIPSITKSVLSNLPIPVIPLQEQEHIINFMEEIALEKSLLKKLLQRKEEFANSYVWERIIKYHEQ